MINEIQNIKKELNLLKDKYETLNNNHIILINNYNTINNKYETLFKEFNILKRNTRYKYPLEKKDSNIDKNIFYNNNIEPNNIDYNDSKYLFFNKDDIGDILTNYYSCIFNNKSHIFIPIDKCKKDKKITYKFRVYNNGQDFPNDTLIKCLNNDSEIYFKHVKIIDFIQNKDDKRFYEIPVEILFKDLDDIKINENYELECYLMSDKEGKIGNKNNGKLNIQILK